MRNGLLLAALLLALTNCIFNSSGLGLPQVSCKLTPENGGQTIVLDPGQVLAPGACSACIYTYTDGKTEPAPLGECQNTTGEGTCPNDSGDLTFPPQACLVVAGVIDGKLNTDISSSEGCIHSACGISVSAKRGVTLAWVAEGVNEVQFKLMQGIQAPTYSAHCAVFVAASAPSAQQVADAFEYIDGGWFTPNVTADTVTGDVVLTTAGSCDTESVIFAMDSR